MGRSVILPQPAKVAELADAQDSGSCGRKVVGVQVPPFAPSFLSLLPGNERASGSPARGTAPEPAMPIDASSYRSIVGNFATGVAVVTTANGDRLHGLTANSLTSVSLDPLLLLVCVDRRANGHAELERCAAFGVSILAADQQDLSNRFARSAEPGPEGMRGAAWSPGLHGAPLLDGAMAHLVCVPHAQLDGGDHTIFVGRVVDGSVAGAGADPLLYFRGAYRGIAPA